MAYVSVRHHSFKSFAINAAWTSVEPRGGWVHFRIAGRKREGGELMLEMMAVCDRATRFWVARRELRDPLAWRRGWTRNEQTSASTG